MTPEKQNLGQKKRIALVSSGGAVKAACFHMGVCLALQEKGFVFQGGGIDQPRYPPGHSKLIDLYVGSSAGAVISAFLASGYTLEEIITSFAESSSKSRLSKIKYWQLFHIGFPHWKAPFKALAKKRIKGASGGLEMLFREYFIFTGVASAKGVEKYLRKVLPLNRFQDLAADLFIVGTDVNHPKRTIFGKLMTLESQIERENCNYTNEVDISHAAAASISLPPFYRPYRITYKDGKNVDYFDGEIRKTLSTHVAKDMGADLIIASYSHQPYQYVKEIGSLADYGATPIAIQAIYQTIEQKIANNKRHHDTKLLVLDTVNQFFKDNDLPDGKRKMLVSLLEQRFNHNPNLHYIYIHPQPNDYEMFFGDHFNLSPKVMEAQMKIGFRAAIQSLKNYDLT